MMMPFFAPPLAARVHVVLRVPRRARCPAGGGDVTLGCVSRPGDASRWGASASARGARLTLAAAVAAHLPCQRGGRSQVCARDARREGVASRGGGVPIKQMELRGAAEARQPRCCLPASATAAAVGVLFVPLGPCARRLTPPPRARAPLQAAARACTAAAWPTTARRLWRRWPQLRGLAGGAARWWAWHARTAVWSSGRPAHPRAQRRASAAALGSAWHACQAARRCAA